MMSSLIYIVEKTTNSQSHCLELGNANSVTAKFGSVYSLIDSQTGKYPENVVLQQDEDHLLIVRDGEVLLVIEEYFDEAREVSFDDTGIILSDIALAGMESDVLVEEPIWSAETGTTITLNNETSNQTTDLANDTQPKIDMSIPSEMRPQEGVPVQNSSMGVLAQEHNEDPSSGSQVAAGEMGWGWYAAALGLGALGMAGSSSSGGSSSSSGGGSTSTSSTTISSAAGIFFSTVQIDLYDTSGNLISSAQHDYSTGDYVYTGSYSGPMLVEISDINGTDTDYTDETTGEAKSLGTSLRAMTTTDGASDKAISVTPLTELATQLAGVTSDNRAVTTDNVAMNGKVATLFGLDNILDKPAVVTEDTSSADAAALKYGQALAILSGADSDAGNASAAQTIATIASSLKEANSDTDAPLKLTSEVADILTKGLEAFNDGPTGRDNTITSSFTFSSVPVLVNADGDVIKVINADVAASTIEVKIKGLSADTVVTLTVGENTTTYTVTSGDIESGYAYVPITASWFQADGDGNYDVVVTVNNVESSTTIKVDTTAPDAPSFELHQDTGDSDVDGITSDTTVDVTLAEGVTNWQYSLDGGSTWIIRTSGSSFELKGSTTYDAGDIQVKQIDKAGNESDVTSNTSAIETLETLAPDLSLEDTGTSNSDGITNSSTVSVTFDVGVDLASWQYSLDGGSTWKDGTGTTFELAANKTYQADTIQVKQIDTQGNEEIASLSSKVVTDNTVSAPVTFLAEDSGQNKTDGITSDTTYRVKLANDVTSWEYSVDSGANWVTGSGTSFELNENQTYAVGSIQVRQTDVAGNVSAIKSNTTAITTDLIAPDAPSASLRNDTGASDEDGITNNTTVDVALADDAVSWQYSLNGGETWSASQAASVTSFALADNTAYQAGDLQIRQYDAAGNVSVVDSNDQIITLDSVVSAPTLSFLLTSNELTSTTVAVTLADDVASWEYSLDGGETWNAGQGERFSLEPLTAYGANAIQVRQTDIAGNVSDVIANESLETDVAIDPPSFELASDTGIAADDSITSSATMNVTLLEGAEGAVSWNYSLDGGITWSDDQDISTTNFDLADNTTYDVGQILVTQTDAEGNVSAYASNNNTVIVDSLVGAPEFSLNTDTGSSDTDGITNDLTVNVDLADDVATWQYSLDSGSTWLDGNGTSFELAANVSYAAGAIQVKQIDLAGNESTATLNDSNITTDTISLDAPTFSLNSDSGSSDTDNITNDSVVNVVLSEDAVAWQYSTDAGLSWDVGTGTSFELAANTSYSIGDIQVQQIDAAGNASVSGTNEAAIEIDTTAITPTLSLNTDSGIDGSDGITNEVVVNFGSNGESNTQSWEYSLDSGSTWLEGSGSSFELNENQVYEEGSIQVRQTDLAGNLSAVGSNSTTIVTDTMPLDAPSFALHADTGESNSDFITSDTTIDVTLDAEAASWEYSLDSGAIWTEGSGTSFEMGGLQTYEIGQIQVRQIDIAGNISAAASNEVQFVSDSLPAPTVQLAEDTGLSDSDNITNDLTVNVSLDVNAASWAYSLDGGTSWIDGEGGSFELEGDTMYAVGSIQVKQFDADENESAIFSSDSEIVTDVHLQPALEVTGNTLFFTVEEDVVHWEYSLDGGASWAESEVESIVLEPNTTYPADSIIVRQEDLAGNKVELAYDQQVVTGDAYEAPSFELFDDTGFSDSDGVTNESSLNVFLSDDSVAYEYSLDSGETWLHGTGAYILLDEGETLPASDFVCYEYDADGNESEMFLDYREGEVIEFAIPFLLAEGTVSWRYSIDGGETFTDAVWGDLDGHFIDLEYGEEYAVGDIQVRQTNANGEVSPIATNDQVIITDEDSPYDVVYANSGSPYDDIIEDSGFDKLDGGLGDTTVASLDYQKTIQLGDTGTYVSMWYLNVDSEEFNSQLVVQMLGANGEPTSDYMRIEHESITEYLNLMDAIPLADTGSFVVTWEQYDEETDTSDYYYQIIDENGAVGGLQSLENYLGYYGQFTDSFIIPVGNNGNFVVTDNYYDESQSLRMLTATLMNADGEIIAEITTSGDPDDPEDDSQVHIRAVGEDGNFVVVSKYEAQLYSSSGVAIGDSMPLNSAVSGAYFEALEVIGDTGSYIITSFKYTYEGEDRYPVISAQIFNAQGEYQGDSIVLGEGELNTKIHHTRSDIGLIGDDKMVVSWTTRDSDGGAGARITYFQTINADGTLSGEAITPFASIGESEEISVRIANIFPVGEQGNYVLLGRVDYVDSGDREYYAKFVSGNGEVTDLEDADLLADNNPRFTVESVGDEGAFVVAWNQTNLSGYGVSVQLYNADGEPIGDTVLLEADPYGSYDRTPSIIELSGGEYIVTWIGDTYEGSEAVTDVYSQKFNADGTLANQSIVYSDGDIPVESNEDGFAYLVNSSLFASDFLSDVDQWYDGLFDTILNADMSYWNSTEVTAGVETSVSTDGLEGGTYYMIVTDLAGNVSVNNVGIVVAETVVFDLITGDSTDVDDQSFSANITYDIYINVGNGSSLTLNDGEQWTFANNLGDDDRITLVSDTTITSFSADTFDNITWSTDFDDVVLNSEGEFSIAAESVDLWENTWASNPDAGLILSQVIATETPEV
ncbi:beta strand repeat-containing protein [Marinomonas polaris]|uniref:beta strand repeat-containing protein n=1 Tax=Marinomonas polaris TaxID=293552 RepID=UPI003F9A168C